MANIKINLNNVKDLFIPKGTKIIDVIKQNTDLLPNKIIGAKIENEIVNCDNLLTKDCNLELIDITDVQGYKINKSGLKFIMEVALKKRFNNAEVSFEHAIGNGVYVKILNHDFNLEDVKILKNDMDEIINRDETIYRLNVRAKDAMDYYKYNNKIEKYLNIHNNTNRVITIFRLENYINYFYSSMPYSTGYVSDFELVFMNKNELALVIPNKNDFNAADYKKYGNVIDCYKKNRNLLEKYNMSYICDINSKISYGQHNEIIQLFETNFNNSLYALVLNIINKNKKFIFLSGPSSSGKTTTAKKLCLYIQSFGYMPYLISTDDYFVDRENTPKNPDGSYDFESIDCVDVESLNKDLNDLINGKEVSLPTYNFIKGEREYLNKPKKVAENSIFVVEGIHCLNKRLSEFLDQELLYKIYLSPFIPIKLDRHNYLSTTDLRLIRRIIRDNNNRGVSVEQTLEMWRNVRLGEEKNIFEYIDNADIILNTSLPYELGVLKVFVEPLLYSVTNDSPYLEDAIRLIRYLENVYPIPSEHVPNESIIREFIGGSVYRNEGDK